FTCGETVTPLESRLSRLGRAFPPHCQRSRAFGCSAYRHREPQKSTAEGRSGQCTFSTRVAFVRLGRAFPPALPTLARVRLQRLSPIGNCRNRPAAAENAANFFPSSTGAAG